MLIRYRNRNSLNKPLHEVLEKFYTAEVLWKIMQQLVYPSQGKSPPDKKPNKVVLVETLETLLDSQRAVRRMFEAMDPRLQAVLEIIVWEGNQRLEDLEDVLGYSLAKRKTVKLNYGYNCERTEYVPDPNLLWLVYDEDRYSDYYEKRLVVGLPPAIRTAFKKHMCKPIGYDLEPIDTLPEQVQTYRCDDQIAEDYRIVADYIDRGHLQFNKNETIRKPCIRALAGLTAGGEFFPNEKMSAKLPLLRHELLVGTLASCGPSLRNAMLEDPPDPEKLLRPLCDALFSHPEWFHETVLSHVKTKGREEFVQQASANLRDVFAMIPTDHWAYCENLVRMVNYREIRIDPMPNTRCFVTVDGSSPGYNFYSRVEVDSSNAWMLLIIPLLQGTAFLLAALGLAEIAYTLPPEHRMWRRSSEHFLTPFDGLVALRLTPAGAYAFGTSDSAELKTSERQRPEIILNPQRLTATCRHIDPITEMSLLEYMEKISDRCYRMTRQSLMRGCTSSAGVAARIKEFRRHICAEPPPFWESFFDVTAQTAVALRTRTNCKVYEVDQDPDLRRLFLTDAILRKKVLKVEGGSVAVEKTNDTAVRKRLASLGYLVK